MKIKFHILTLEMRHTFTIAHGSRDDIDAFIVELQDGEHRGFGEATPIPYYGVTAEGMRDKLSEYQQIIEAHDLQNPEDFWAYMHPYLKNDNFAHCALDMAAWDLYGKKIGKPLYQHWGLSLENIPYSNYTIGIDSIEKMVSKMKEFDFPIYKIKLGTEHDVEIVKKLRKHTDALFRVDANCAWGVEETIRNSEEFAKLNVEFIEQPMQKDDYEPMIEVMKYSKLPLIADESCIVEEDVKKCYGKFHGVNVKLAKCAGITPALRMINEAKSLNMKVMCGCMTETSIGISAIGQLVPLLDYVDMDGSILIKNDPAEGVYLDKGKPIFPSRNGTGAWMA
ncbi:MAG: dipeptide epimerase [Spirosomaceae bacterium]|nr:dipeptide epimerase [Spirosomataceae bacterium]